MKYLYKITYVCVSADEQRIQLIAFDSNFRDITHEFLDRVHLAIGGTENFAIGSIEYVGEIVIAE